MWSAIDQPTTQRTLKEQNGLRNWPGRTIRKDLPIEACYEVGVIQAACCPVG
jgi:hypothetical protein